MQLLKKVCQISTVEALCVAWCSKGRTDDDDDDDDKDNDDDDDNDVWWHQGSGHVNNQFLPKWNKENV